MDFEKRKNGDIGNNCLMPIDGTDFRIPQTGKATTSNWFASHKYVGKSALRYKIWVNILGGDLVWIQGPYPAGQFTNIKNDKKVLRQFLKTGKCIEADKGYLGAANEIKCPNNSCNPVKNKGMQSCTQSHHETINRQLKMWGILKEVYRHDIKWHGKVFQVIAIIMQLAIKNNSPLFQVKYKD